MPTRLVLILVACWLVACGEKPAETAVEAREENVVHVGGLSYRAVLFRELNPRVAPDRSLVETSAAEAGVGLYAAFVHVCNDSDEPQPATGQIVLEDLDGDSIVDLAGTSGGSGRIELLLGDGAGGFAEGWSRPIDNIPDEVIVADVNDDGAPDIVAGGAPDHIDIVFSDP